MHARAAVLFCLAAPPTALLAQTTHQVGPGGFAQIRDALAVAAPGDEIVVAPGVYAQFSATVGVTIRASTPGAASVVYDLAFAPPGCLQNALCATFQGPTLFQIPTGQTAVVSGLRFLPTTQATPVPGVFVRHRVVVAGIVTFEACDFAADDVTPLNVGQGSHVSLIGCTLVGGGATLTAHGMSVTLATVTAVGSSFTGNAPVTSAPGSGIDMPSGAKLHGSELVVTGGASSFGQSPALRASASTVWLADSVLTGGGTACPIAASGGSLGLARTVLAPTAGCPVLPNRSLLGVDQPTPPTNGTAYTLHFQTDPNLPVFVYAANAIGSASLPGLFEQPICLGGVFFAGAGVADGNGLLSLSWPMPAGAFVGTPLWLQGVSGATLPLQLSPLTGGIVR
ncbi:MAG: hypothetical protein JNL08_11790 [Planctomycetes bacterium]|nr:hypothetical protein [Planctomycetota bacterium]